jgi:hypothetical protein
VWDVGGSVTPESWKDNFRKEMHDTSHPSTPTPTHTDNAPSGWRIHAFVKRVSNEKNVPQLGERFQFVYFGPVGNVVVAHVQDF